MFFLGVFRKRINAQSALACLISEIIVGMGRLTAEINKASLDGWLFAFAGINFLHFAIFLFVFCVAVLVGVSLMTRAPSDESIRGPTYQTTVAADKEASRARWGWPEVVHSIIVVAMIVLILLYFSLLRT